jgi:septal ring factor EnvC (AmiA/AmiB activator)
MSCISLVASPDARANTASGLCGLLGLVMMISAAFGFVLSPFCGIGYLIGSLSAGACAMIIRRWMLVQRIGHAVTTLKRENDEFADENDRLREANDRLELTSSQLSEDISTLTQAMRDVGESSENFMGRLKSMHDQYRHENEKHSKLLTQQSRLLLLQLFTHFDTDLSNTLSTEELQRAYSHLQAVLPGVSMDELELMAKQKEITLRDVEGLLAVGEVAAATPR